MATREESADLLTWVVPRIVLACNATVCQIAELLPGDTDLFLCAGSSWTVGETSNAVMPLAADSIAAQALQTSQPIIFDSRAPTAHAGEHGFAPPAARSGVSIPVIIPGRPLRVLNVYSTRRRAFTRADVRFLQSVANMLAGIARQQLCQREIESIVGLSRALRSAATRAEMPSIILAQVRALIICAGGAILLSRSSGVLAVALGDGIWARATGTLVNNSFGISGQVVRDSTPFLGYARTKPVDFAPDVPLGHTHTVACVPLLFGGSTVGVLWVASPSVITYDELHLLGGIADIAASALYRADLTEQTTRLFREHQQLSEELRRAERHLAGIVESASDLVISADVDGRIVTWNRAAERISGFSREQAIGRRLSDYCTQGDQSVMEGLLNQFSASPRTDQIDELPLVGAAGQTIPISWRFSPLQNDLGEITGIVAVGRDLLEQRRLEAQLFQAAKMTSMGIMASGIGHELRNPLGIISASAQLAQNHLADPDLVGTCLTRIHTATRRAALIIDSLLTFAQPGRESRHPLSINQVLAATLTLLEHQIHHRQIVFTTMLDPLLPPVIGNPALLQQVFTNLILNACQAMPAGGALAVTSRLSDASTVEVCVRDEGCGISAEVLKHIFDPFFTTRPVGQGTGLGLAISYSIVQQHGGQIEVFSQPGAGSTFAVRLPVAETQQTQGTLSYDQDSHR
ncbi:MAG: GAF domain-containing protein [Chloroflexales bacterium]|nr:GAF domain-containing protein [Chloroflexales bacterium]